MSKIDRYIRHDNYERFVYKIFKRHDKDKDNFLNKEGKSNESIKFLLPLLTTIEFTTLMNNFKDPNLKETDINEIYLRMMGTSSSDLGIDFKSFFENSLFKTSSQ